MNEKWRKNTVKYANISKVSDGIIMKSQTGRNQVSNATIINDTGIMPIIDDSDSQPLAISIEYVGKIVQVFLDIMHENVPMKKH